jgi:hypothetical protein
LGAALLLDLATPPAASSTPVTKQNARPPQHAR